MKKIKISIYTIEDISLKHSNVESQQIQQLQNICFELLCSNYTHVSAYHCCRTRDIDQYYKSGLLLGDIGRARRQAYSIFKETDRIDAIIDSMEEVYVRGTNGRLWLFYSMYGAYLDFVHQAA